MKIFDTHAHYDDEAFDSDRDELLKRLLSTDIDTIVNVGASLSGCRESVGLAKNMIIYMRQSECIPMIMTSLMRNFLTG